MAKYQVKWLIKGLATDRKYLRPGETVDLSPEAAARSVEVGSLQLIQQPKAAAPPEAPGAGTSTDVPAGGQVEETANLQEMSKAQLVEYGKEQLGLSLDINKTKANLLAAIEEAAGK